MAGRCSAALVEPPVAATTAAAFSSALRVTMSRGRILSAIRSMTFSPAAMQKRSQNLVRRGRAGRIGQRQADGLGHRGHGVGGELRAASAGRGACHLLELIEIVGTHLAD